MLMEPVSFTRSFLDPEDPKVNKTKILVFPDLQNVMPGQLHFNHHLDIFCQERLSVTEFSRKARPITHIYMKRFPSRNLVHQL